MSWAACCANKQMQDLVFGQSSSMMYKDAAKGRREASCQWCFELTQMFVLGKSVTWICDNCKGVSDACEKCGQPVRQQTIRKDNYKTCSICFLKNFKKVEKTKVATITNSRSLTALQKELEKVTVFRTNAAKAGMLRPFLFLVSLPPVQRMQIAINLGWTFLVEACLGDAHAEAWDIMTRKGLGLRDRMTRMRDTWLRRETNWYSVLLPLCEELCVPAYMNWSEEFVSPKMSYAEALKECHSGSPGNLDSLENEFTDKIGKQQRARMSSLQACSLAELKNSEPIRKLLSLPCLQNPAVQPLLSYAIDSSYLILARRDGSDGTGAVEPEDLLHDVVTFMSGVCETEKDLFESCMSVAKAKIGRDGVVMERDEAPPGSMLNANIAGFWLTMDLLDIDVGTPTGKILPVVFQMLLHKGRLLMHGIRLEDYSRGDFAD
eukprot:CAMPEP_0206247206 /NCGR_PEP_ID=MMETSP0047_2-20121206/19684_1 /ASSEMBLY_ACC=CAM_ASM_000192 /TAXON_ID=195065 /ORGANISM="Chroomonas mesostigmatica_cf, Strain CCMP1168" /LENGTH=433 /DNA_ID=CAMNT_0053672711 /DNA_START=57 /DNA_END=1358 /DNA_ORIENTATION=+